MVGSEGGPCFVGASPGRAAERAEAGTVLPSAYKGRAIAATVLGELARTLSLFDPLWASLSPAEQTRVLQLLIDLDTQIMNLLHLAPDIQEAIPFLPRTERGRDPICERMVRPIAAELDMSRQRRI